MPYMHVGKKVYKEKEDGTRGEFVGTAKGPVKDYLAALYAHAEDGAGIKKHKKKKKDPYAHAR